MSEDHNTLCARCDARIGPCIEFGCTNRYDHKAGAYCDACQVEEHRKEWGKTHVIA